MPNTGGDFLSGVPKACFDNANPCVALASKDKSLLTAAEQLANLNEVIEADGCGSGHLNDERRAKQAVSPDDNATAFN